MAVEVRLDAARRAAQPLELVPGRAGRSGDAIADLAVDLADELECLGLEHRRIRFGPRLLPDAPPVSISYTSAPRCGANGNSSDAAVAVGEPPRVLAGVELRVVDHVEQLHDRGDRGVEREPAGHVPGDLVDRPVGLAHERQRVALGVCAAA